MKILVVYPYLVDHSAAGHSLMYETLLGLSAMGHHITVVSGEGGYMQALRPHSAPGGVAWSGQSRWGRYGCTVR